MEIDAKTGFGVVGAYVAASIAAGVGATILFGGEPTTPDPRRIDTLIDSSTAAYVLVSAGILAAIAFVFRGSSREIFFESTPGRRSPLYLLFPLVVAGVAAWAFTGVPFAAYSAGDILLVVLAASAIAFNEEVVTRGFLLVGLRNRGVAEWQVWLITSVVFSLLHAVNLLAGANLTQLAVTLASGTLYYASRRVTGTLFVPIILHAAYDIGFFLLGGIHAPEAALPGGVLDIHLGAFLVQLFAAILFVTLGRRLMTAEKPG